MMCTGASRRAFTYVETRPAVPSHLRRTGPLLRSVVARASDDNGDRIDYAALWQAHIDTEFTEKSADAAVATMVEHATVNHIPTLMGGAGRELLREFYARHFIPKMPNDVVIKPINRTIAPEAHRVMDEFLFEMLPGVAPTGKRVSVPFVVVVDFEGTKLKAERIYWDQATVLKQLGLLPEGLPVAGAEQSLKAADPAAVPSNGMLRAVGAV
ncbi:carboxymethylene butenolidase [Monoraphidium neglectum]|uniref:Carboxymethylene butenolidase n=1 Tax=Monoraphidium neglectum TaxID=145388 RepID=A0A0D2MXL0_9CHLO|nr:carboxymethylene butenolidase [Monoraphidium neglectum]KIZ05112.1 carboxymethylene butenolidase [Monoraphidium neglectum]|eukprot:XP_013904131.1 carboxymethylene butenolidase [Monoraphidium neglectum]